MTTVREVRLPALSATMESAVLIAWKVAPGDPVGEGQPIAEVSTDKVDMDLEAPFAGVIETLMVAAGETVPLGATLATMATESEDLLDGLGLDGQSAEPLASPEPTTLEESPSSQQPIAPDTSRIVSAVPPARKLARELGVDLAEVAPTGARGQIVPADVRRHVESGADRSRGMQVETSQPRPASQGPESETGVSESAGSDPRRIAIRRATAEVMNRSATIPQFTLWRTLVLDRAANRKGGLGWTTVMMRALARCLRDHPELNAEWDVASASPIPRSEVRVGLAVDRPGVGLVVATIDGPDLLDPEEAERSVRAVADRTRTGKLRPEDLAQASVSLSNLGGLGVDRFNALLFPPQAVIVSAGTIRMRPVATGDGALKAALTCEFGLTVDHRVADGADGARFLESFARDMEESAEQ